MQTVTRNYFQLVNSLPGEVYFRISKHLGCTVSDVIKRKLTPDIKFLIMRYTLEIQQEVKTQKALDDKMKDMEI